MSSKLAFLKNAFEKKASNTGGDQTWKLLFPFWKMPDDSVAIVRFLPDADSENNLGFLVEKLEHELVINGQKKKVPCLSQFGEKCPICTASREAYDAKDETTGKSLYRKKSYIGQVIVVESPIEHDQTQLVKLIEFGPAVFKQIQAAFQSGDLEEAPYEFKGGYNFRIKKTKSGQYASYTTSSFSPKQSDLEDEIIEQLNLFNLADYRGNKLDVAVIESMLLAHQTGANFNEPDESDGDAPAAAPVPAPVKAAKAAPAAEAYEAPAPAAAPAAGKPLSALEQLRARAKAQKVE